MLKAHRCRNYAIFRIPKEGVNMIFRAAAPAVCKFVKPLSLCKFDAFIMSAEDGHLVGLSICRHFTAHIVKLLPAHYMSRDFMDTPPL
jgi:hypothetical protein